MQTLKVDQINELLQKAARKNKGGKYKGFSSQKFWKIKTPISQNRNPRKWKKTENKKYLKK